MNAPPTDLHQRTSELDWAHRASPFAWSVMVYGGENPRTGQPQPQLEFQFTKQAYPGHHGYSIQGILWRANDYAKGEHRTEFAVRDVDGAVIYQGPVLNEIEAPAVFRMLSDHDLTALSMDHRRFQRTTRGDRL